MVKTRKQSKNIDPPALPPVAPPKRKRKNDVASASSAAQTQDQAPLKRQRKEKDPAAGKTTTARTAPAPTGPAAKKASTSIARKKKKEAARRKTAGVGQRARVDLTKDDDDDDDYDDDNSIADEATQRPQPIAPQDGDDDEADSRYALGSRKSRKAKKPAASITRRTAELTFEEDGLQEVDKAEAAVANASKRKLGQVTNPGPTPWTLVNDIASGRTNKQDVPQAQGKGKGKGKQKIAPALGVPSKMVMFTAIEAIAALSLYQGGTMSIPAKIDAQSRQPHAPLQTGEYLSYPVKGTYHLGSIGRYGLDTAPPPLPFSLTVPLSEHSFVAHTQAASAASPPRPGLGFASTFSTRTKPPSIRRPNNYCFTFGKFKGRRMDSVPIDYLRSIREGDEYYNDAKLQQAFEDLYPKGLYESEAESFTFEKGGFKGKRLDEVPKTYLWGLLRKAKNEELPKKGKGRLERALEVWEKRQLDLTTD